MDKLDWYGRMGVGEVIAVDRHTRSIRQWTRADDGLSEREGDADGWFALASLEGVMLHGGDLRIRSVR